jgi:TolB-like protein/tRNA A-37 threonylcarbamoyl transferase component Bud32/Tfp pilus assembly protein PilF
MIGQTLGRYRIVEKLGAGGMGEVYRAHDEQLKRDVALKVLLADTLADDRARKRFRREAETLSKLNHPNIAQIHDFGSQDELDFLVMEQVPGESLKERLDKGSLPEKELIRLGGQIADALQEAHEQGIVHRDLKPGNVKLTARGQAKVLDFGIAKLLQAATEATTQTFTETHSLAGTLPYMAPEQLRGEEIDARSDLYSFGVMLYEMATARRPFEEKLSTALSDAILHQAPPAPRTVNRRLSAGLENVILKCLEKEPERRYQSAKEARIDLERLGAGIPVAAPARPRPWTRRLAVAAVALVVLAALLVGFNVGGLRDRLLGEPTQITSLAVLPLENLSGDAEQQYFVDGIHEELTATLAKIGSLKVISRSSAMRYQETDKPLQQIAEELGVEAVVEGSVRRAGNQVRVTVQLIKADTDEHLFAENYQRELRDILFLQSEIAQAISRQVQVTLSPQEEARLASARPIDPEAYQAYLKGQHFLAKWTEDGTRKSIEYFLQAIDIDPTYAPAYARLGWAYNNLSFWGYAPPEETLPRVRAAVTRALELDDGLAEAHTVLGSIKLTSDWDWPGAERELRRALELNPDSVDALLEYSFYSAVMGRFDEGIAANKRAIQLDPLTPTTTIGLGWMYYFTRQYDESIRQLEKALELDPNSPYAHMELAWNYADTGKYAEAVASCQKALDLLADDQVILGACGQRYAISGRRDEALKLLDQLMEMSASRYVDAYYIATIHAGLGDVHRTLDWLERAYEQRSPSMVFLKIAPFTDGVRDDPRFQSLLRRMNFPE